MTTAALGGHTTVADGLLVRRTSVVHSLPAQTKLVALLAFVLVVVATPSRAWPAFVGYALALGAVVTVARLPWRAVLSRMLVETPFVVFALLMPFVATGPRVDVLGIGLSRSGLVGGALLLAKGTFGVLAAVVLASSTTPRDMLVGLERLRIPSVLVSIISFAVRYLSIAGESLQRAQVARLARCGDEGRVSQLRAVAGTAGSTFVRTYERGERVHYAMLSRGLDGAMPALRSTRTTGAQWLTALSLPAAALVVLLVALLAA